MSDMEHIEELVDERHKTWCIHCGRNLACLVVSHDHVPTKALLRKPWPPELPVVDVCKSCNEGFARDEEYLVAFLGCVLSGSAELDAQSDPTVRRILQRNERLRAHIERSRTSYQTLFGETRHMWNPEQARIERIVLKNARGHAVFEFGEPMLQAPHHVWWLPLLALTRTEREEFEDAEAGSVWPEVGSRMMTRWLTGQDLSAGWVIVQEGVYRYSVSCDSGMRVRTVLSEYLATEVWWS